MVLFANELSNAELDQRQLAEKSESLALQNRRLKRFTIAASHDLQEPLRTMMGICMFMRSDYADTLDEEGKRLLEDLQKRAAQLSGLVKHLLEHSQGDTKKVEFETLDLNWVVDEAKCNLKAAIDDASAKIDFANLPTIVGNRFQLIRLFQNLISNAIKFRHSQQQCVVTIRAHTDRLKHVIEIADNGIGVPEQHHEAVFEEFRRLHHKDAYPGTGIGLSLCAEIMESHGGRIALRPDEAEGATFVVEFPQN